VIFFEYLADYTLAINNYCGGMALMASNGIGGST
jgi:hypothetical protein